MTSQVPFLDSLLQSYQFVFPYSRMLGLLFLSVAILVLSETVPAASAANVRGMSIRDLRNSRAHSLGNEPGGGQEGIKVSKLEHT